ncbi:hypothetical protein [Streptomyces sp. NPDC058751]|uniref:hypothetical protein n=1 Tax=Streptomyces sp. NPDC058751 TaxID=3346623 RepID=UPI0036BEE2BA
MKRCVAVAAVAVALITAPTAAHAVSSANAAHVTALSAHAPALSVHAPAPRAAQTAPTARIVAPGEHVTEPGGAEFWLTPEGKHWTTPDNPEPQFRSVVDGNIDLTRPGVSATVEATAEGHVTLSGVYYGGTGTASRVIVRTTAGTLHAKLLELPGNPGWGVWYVSTDLSPAEDGLGVEHVVVRNTEGGVYSRLDLK